jgi:LuxR family maltose regulon positive regulatory protein
VLEQPHLYSVGRVGAEQLAVTVEEATAILQHLHQSIDAVEQRVRSVDGWMAGLLYGGDPLAGIDAAERHGMLIAKIMDDLPQVAQDLLIETAILDEVDGARAERITGSDVHAAMETLRDLHLPITWLNSGASFRLQSRVRDYALSRFARLPLARQRSAHRRHGDLLASEGAFEPAVHEYLEAGEGAAARSAALTCIVSILERGDLDLVDEWLQLFDTEEKTARPTAFTIARLFVANARTEVGEALELADLIMDAGALPDLLHLYDRTGELLALAYASGLRNDRYEQVLQQSPPSTGIQVVEYARSLTIPGKPAPRPPRSKGPHDVTIFAVDWHLGRLHLIPASTGPGLLDLLTGPYRIAAARVQGRTQEALDAYRRYSSSVGRLPLLTYIGPEVLLDAGLIDEAHETVLRGRELVEQKNVGQYALASIIVEAKILLRGKRQPAAALTLLDRRWEFPPFTEANERVDLWRGLAMLQLQQDQMARDVLRSAVQRMQENEHLLALSTAAVYLSEAEWRCDDPDAADAAADLALEAAGRLGTNHLLIQALTDFPAVLARRLDVEQSVDTEWHQFSRPISVQSAYRVVDSPEPQVRFHDFGVPTIDLLGQRVQPRLTKTFEVLAFILVQPRHATTRSKLLAGLFEIDDTSTRTYLRQAFKWLRFVLPEGGLIMQDDHVAIDPQIFITSDSGRFKQLTIEVGRLRGDDQMEALTSALAILDSGEYLEGSHSAWVLQRRAELTSQRPDLLITLARRLLDANRLLEADSFLRRALEEDPLRESAWRMRMRIMVEFGDHDGLNESLKLCAAALAEIGVQPSAATRNLYATLAR